MCQSIDSENVAPKFGTFPDVKCPNSSCQQLFQDKKQYMSHGCFVVGRICGIGKCPFITFHSSDKVAKEMLVEHWEKCHDEMPTYQCYLHHCPKAFFTLKEMDKHFKDHGNENYDHSQ